MHDSRPYYVRSVDTNGNVREDFAGYTATDALRVAAAVQAAGGLEICLVRKVPQGPFWRPC